MSGRAARWAAADGWSAVGADLDQVPVGVAQVHAEDGAGGAGSFDRALFDGDAVAGQFRDDSVERVGGDQTQVGAARGWVGRFGFEFVAELMEVDFAVTEGEGASAALERYWGHAQDPGVELDRDIDIGDGQD